MLFRLLALLQLTRAALAFTAIADAWTVLLLHSPDAPPSESTSWLVLKMIIIGVISFGLYGFGMSLNDLLDARHDRIFAPRRPIPSGRIRPRTAIIVSLFLLMLSLFAAALLGMLSINLSNLQRLADLIPWPFVFALATAILILFYDAAGKYLGGLGILTLGAIRGLHCLVGNPRTPLLFLSLFLLTHVFFVSLLAYRLENKRPRLGFWDVLWACIIYAGIVLTAVLYMNHRGVFSHPFVNLILGPTCAALIYGAWAVYTLRKPHLSDRQKGDRLMLLGLFWLFAYDASILLANQQFLAALAVFLLLLCAVITFFSIRSLGRFLAHPHLEYRLGRPSDPRPPVPPPV